MPSIVIEPATAEYLRALIAGYDVFAQAFGLAVAPGYLEFDDALAYSLEQVTNGGVAPEWMSYLFVEPEQRALIGLGGFHGPPDDDGVEIGYGIAPSHRRRGLATAAARALVQRARDAGVTTVVAHTLAEHNASTSVLEGLGFRRTDEGKDPEVGPIWRWELAVAT